MFTEFFAAHLSAIVAIVVLLPVLVFSLALFAEGVRRLRWTPAETAASRSRAAGFRRLSAIVPPVVAGGGAGLRHGFAAPREHD